MQLHRLSTTIAVFCWLGVSAVLSEGFAARTITTPSTSSVAFVSSSLSSSSRQRTLPTSSTKRNTILNLVRSIPSGGSATTTTTSSNTALFASSTGEAVKCPFTKFMAAFGSVWGSFGVMYILAKAITRVMPIALEPFKAGSALVFSPLQWSLYAASCLLFAYAEGYKGFHLKFAPLCVKRSFTLLIGTPQGNNPLHYLFAPLYSMGLFQATKKRMTVSWCVSLGVASVVAVVKRLPAAPRCILDAGVVVGLTLGSASILYHYARSILTGKLPDIDACLPAAKPAAN
mmetsp:Transcript_2741/g.7329  ORF Transcript_2741/g.7329 Transcript_2741/m.7329 type:complete len:287 (-) Transcript_2741:1486-2346(-)